MPLRLLQSTVAALALTPAFALADQGPLQPEIVVVGTALDQSEADVLQGVEQLDRTEVLLGLGQGIGASLERRPGVASTGFAAGASRPIIRGLGEDRIRVLTNGLGQIDVSTVSPDHAVTVDPFEAQSIEILRGPAALAYGGNAVGGVVNVVDGRIAETVPDQAFSGEVYAGLTTGLDQGELGVQGRGLLGDHFVVTAMAFTRESSDYAIPGFAFAPAARLEAIAEGADPIAFAKGAAPNSFANLDVGALGFTFVSEFGFIGLGVKRLEARYGFPEDEVIAVKQSGAPFIEMESTRYDLRAGSSRPFWVFEKGRIDLSVVDYEHSENEEGEVGTIFKSEGFEGRVELTHMPIGDLRGIVGVSGLSTEVSAIGEEAFLTPTEVQEIGVFAVQEWRLNEFWALEGGLRLDRRTLDNRTFGERDFNTVSASLGAAFRPNADWFFSLTLARTERAPTELELFADGPHKATQAFEIGDQDLDKETALSIEAKARYATPRLRVEASLFHFDFADFINLSDTGLEDPIEELPIFVFAQEDAAFSGAEVSVDWTILGEADRGDRFGLYGALSLVQADADSGDLPRIPPQTMTIGAKGALGPLAGSLEWVRAEDQDRVATFETSTPGYDLINAQLIYTPGPDDRLTFVLDGRNLGDEEVRSHTSFVKALAPQPGRTVRFAIRATF
jgi:iron complex outermembrane recepter protein